MKFIKITDNYLVNIENIFSLEERVIPNDVACDEYNKKVDMLSKDIVDNPPSFIVGEDDVYYNPKTYEGEVTQAMKDDYHDRLSEYFTELVGEAPPLYITEYNIILCTGVKIQTSESKYKAIIKTIEELDKETK